VYNNPIAFTDPTGHECQPQPECEEVDAELKPEPTMACSIIPGYVCRPLVPKAPPMYVRPPVSPDELSDAGKKMMDYYIYLKGNYYHDLTVYQFLGLMLMYEIYGNRLAQYWVIESAVDQLFARSHGTNMANPYCPGTAGPCIAGIFNYLGAYSESAQGHASKNVVDVPVLLPDNPFATGNYMDDAAYLGNLIMSRRAENLVFQGIHVGNTWMKPWVSNARNHLNIVNDPWVPNGLLALDGTFMAFSVTQEDFWMCVMENGYGHC
jgi:hypothetical protein